MKVTLYLPYYDYNDGDFDVKNDYYKSNEDYFNAMQQNVQQTRGAVINSMSNYVNGGSIRDYQTSDGQTYRYGQQASQNEDKVAYAQCEAILYNEEGKDEKVDEFIEDYVSNDVQLYILNLDLDSSEEDFEQEINLWTTEHNNIQKYSNVKGDDWVLDNEPKRNIKLKFTNNANEEKFAELVNCKIMEKQGMNIYVVLAEEIKLIEKIQ